MKTLTPLASLLLCVQFMSAQSAIPYRLIGTRHSSPADSIREMEYNISVEQNLDASSIRNAICQVLKNEKPTGYEILAVSIYYKLESYVPEDGTDTKVAAERRERWIAQYHWNKDSPKDKRRLVVKKDPRGQPLAEWRFYDFDHTKACK